jgi:putative hemolysin
LELNWPLKILLILICLVFLAFFSSAEVALFSLDKKKLRNFLTERNLIAHYINKLLGDPQRTLVTLLLGTTIVSVAASILGVELALSFAASYKVSVEFAVVTQIIVLTILILLLGEVTPKLWANRHPETVIKFVAVPIHWMSVFFFPISKILTVMLKLLTKNLEVPRSRTALQESDLTELANLSIEKGTIEEGEHELIHGIVSFKNVTAREIMTPRVDMAAIAIDESFDGLIAIINESGHSRIPLYQDNLDKILGIIYAKDLLPFIKNPHLRKSLSLKSISREVIFVPSSKMINDLLHEFQEKKIHLGIVVDEYGGTAGLISLEDILEEIVGEIRDENEKEEVGITKLSETQFSVLGKVQIVELNNTLSENFSSENDDYDTVGGFIFNQAGKIPQQGYSFIQNNYKFTVKEVLKKRVKKVMIEKMSEK